MTGIVITVHNRPHHTAQTFESLKRSTLNDCMVIIVDDGSDYETQAVVHDFYLPGVPITKYRNAHAMGVKRSLLLGIEFALEIGCDVVTNLDNDVLVKKEWLIKLRELYYTFPSEIITGFHSTTKNRDGSERHRITSTIKTVVSKESVGGINMMFDSYAYRTYIKPALEMPVGNWDHEACKLAKGVICAVPSLIQHTGITNSSMGHNQELPDVADDFAELELPTVTLIGLDTNHYDDLKYAAMISTLNIKFGAVKLLGPADVSISNKEEYNRFVIKELHKYVKTSHMLIIQADGYVLDSGAWDPDFLNYDYIGATWVYKDGMNVGNGGFSLRSKKLMEWISTYIEGNTYPEDHVICRVARPGLEMLGFKFAPEEVANRFAIEAYSADKLPGANKYTGQFGFHGWLVDYTDSGLLHAPQKPFNPRKRISGGRWL